MLTTASPLRLWKCPCWFTRVTALAAFATVCAAEPVLVPPEVKSAVVKITATLRPPDPVRPWTRQRPVITMEGVGTVIGGQRILTNEHLVRHATRIRIQPADSSETFEARTEHAAPEIDLALLTIEHPTFFAAHPALELARGFPRIGDETLLCRIADEGTALDPLQGRLTKIAFEPIQRGAFWLNYQVAAEIIPGNSGAPLVLGGKLLGVVRSRFPAVALAVSHVEIQWFLDGAALGRLDGKPRLHETFMILHRQPGLRAFLALPDSVHGIVVTRPYSNAADYPLRVWDVITHVDDVALDDEGYGVTPEGVRVRVGYFVQDRARGGSVRLTVQRGTQAQDVMVPTPTTSTQLIPRLNDRWPPYFVFGPLVLTKATQEYLDFLDTPEGEKVTAREALIRIGDPLTTRRTEAPAFPGEEIVLVPSKLLPHPLADGAFNPQGRVVQSINGIAVRNLAHAVELLRDASQEYVVVDFAGREAALLVFPRAECVAATPDLLAANQIPVQGTPELMAIFEGSSK